MSEREKNRKQDKERGGERTGNQERVSVEIEKIVRLHMCVDNATNPCCVPIMFYSDPFHPFPLYL